MPDFRITVETDDKTDADAYAKEILAEHGENFDAAQGDFLVSVEGRTITLDVLNVGAGDIDSLGEEIFSDARVDAMTVAQREGDRFFTRDPGDDVI